MTTSQSAKEFYVYILRNPLKKYEWFYVGKGTGNRWKQYLNGHDRRNSQKDNTINKIHAADMEPVIEIKWSGPDEKYALGLEVALIATWKRKCDGGTLTNVTLGGEGASGYIHSEESLLKMSKAHKGRLPFSEESRLKMSLAHTGTKKSEETRLRMSKKKSKETCLKIGLANKRRVVSKETRRKISEVQTGRVASDEARCNMVFAQARRKAPFPEGSRKPTYIETRAADARVNRR
jgi:hypothetical protein